MTTIAATSTPVALAAKAATSTIPIVFTVGGDPVQVGLVSNLSRPDGNLTGVTRFNVELGPKRLELLHELTPGASEVAMLVNPSNPNTERFSTDLQNAAHALGIKIHTVPAGVESEFDAVFEMWGQQHVNALVIANDPVLNSRIEHLATLALRYRIAAVYQYRKFVETGGLISYSASNAYSHRQLGTYVGRILAGAKPGDLPIEQSTKIDLIINLKTAKALGLTVPPGWLLNMSRRNLLGFVGGTAATWAITARAQKAMVTIGYFSSTSPGPSDPVLAAFRQGLSEAGYVEARNVTIEYRWAESHFDRLSELAADLVRRRVDLIVTAGGPTSAIAANAKPLLSRHFLARSVTRLRWA